MKNKMLLKLQRLKALPISIWKWFEDDKDFRNILGQINGQTMLKPDKLYHIYHFLKYANAIDGCIVEVGVWKGGNLRMISQITDKTLYGFDLFDKVDVQSVSNFLGNKKNIILIKGDLKDTLGQISDQKFSFVHIDCGFADLIAYSLNFFYERMAKGGIIIIDDFGDLAWPETVKTVKDFLANKPEHIVPLAKQQGLIIKV